MDPVIIALLGLALLLAILVMIRLCIWIAKFSLQVEYLKMEIKRSTGKSERERWERELSALRWSILPFMNRRRYYKLRRLFRKSK